MGASSNVNKVVASVVVPGSVRAGDQLVLVVTANKDTTIDTPAGWTLLGSAQDGATATKLEMTSAVFTRTAAGGTAGSTVAARFGVRAKAAVTLVAYRNAETVTTALSSVLKASSTDLATPATAIAEDDTTVVSFWSNKTSGNTGWAVPGGVTERAVSVGSGTGRITAAVGDSVVDTGDWPGATATSTVATKKGIAWTVLVPPVIVPNQAPTAALSLSCVELECMFDASGSTDSDGTIARYDWDFGDGTLLADGGATPTHTYTADGSYDVTVTVTDNQGATDNAMATASPTDPVGGTPTPAVFRVGASSNVNKVVASVVVPGSVRAGDQLVLVVTANKDTTIDTPAGWTLLGSAQDGATATKLEMTSAVFTRTAAGGTAGSTVAARFGVRAKAAVTLVAYRNAETVTTALSSVLKASSTDLATPATAIAEDDTTVVSFWSNKTSGNTGWAVPGGVTERAVSVGSGTGRITAAVGDSVVDTGDWPGATAASTVATKKGIAWTVLVPPVIVPNQAPTAALSLSCVELECMFDASGSTDSDGTIARYDWDFGDGTLLADGGATPTHTYTADGSYDVTVTVTDNQGATDNAADTVDVADVIPTSAFTAECDDLDCVFDAGGSSDANGAIGTYDWDFGDGNLLPDGGPNPTHTYAAEGVYDVTLTVTDDEGSTGRATEPIDVVITPNVDPTAAFTVNCDDYDCAFDAGSSSDSDGAIVAYDWDFGDGTVVPDGGAGPVHTYAGDGTYDVTLTVTDDEGGSDQTTVSLNVQFTPNADPTATFTFGCDELDCSFDATASSDSDGTIVTYDWDFGDGTLLADGGSFPDHSFGADGDYTVTLTVTDDEGGTDSDGQLVGVVNLRIPPVAAFTSSCDGLVCTFDASGSTDSDGLIVSFEWDFGDGDTSTEAIKENNFPFPGDYDVELTITDDDGDTDTVVATVTVDIPAAPNPAIPPDTPRSDTPYIDAAEITDLEYIGNRVYVVGSFGSLRNDNATGPIVNQGLVAAFDIDSGQVDTTFDPSFGGGGVTEIARNPDGSRLYVVGRFNTVNGNSKLRVAAIDPITGNTINSFTANTNSAATSVAVTGDTVYIGGQFSTVNGQPRLGLAAVDATTGELLDDFRIDLTGGQGVNGMINVQAMVLSDDLTRLLVVSTAREMDGQPRWGIGLIDTATNALLPWRTRLFEENLSSIGGIQRLYTADIAPNGQYFVVGSGSGGDRPPISDTAIAFPLAGNDSVEPLWISRMFDSVYSIAITGDAVYVGGHMNYAESPTAPDPWPGLTTQGYGRGQGLSGYGLGDDVVIRDHIAALDPAEGKAIEWNPGSNSFEGNKAMLAMPRGIVTAGDGRIQGSLNVGSIAFYDVNELETPGANDTKILYPIEGRIETADEEFIVGGTATAASGVARVQLEVRDIDTGRYLQDDLTTWGGWNAILTPLMEPGATETVWTQPLVISGNRRIRFLARAFGANGTADPVKDEQRIETFGLSDETPGTGISAPRGVVSETTFTVTGTASDDIGIASIRMSVRDAQDRYLQDDGSVNDIYNTFTTFPDVIGAPDATWSYELTVPYEGEWTMEAIAVDTSGQSDLRGSVRTWLVNTNAVPPEVAILTPVAVNPPFDVVYTVEPGEPMTFTGSAVDDEGLRIVEIRLRNRITDENLTGSGEWGVGLRRDWYRISPTNIAGTTYNWSYTTPFILEQGRYELEVRAEDDSGLTTSSTFEAELDVDVEIPGDSPPDARLDVTGTQTDVQVLQFDITGTATDDFGVADVLFEVYNRDLRLYLQDDGTLGATLTRVTGAVLDLADPTSVTWSYRVDLPEEGSYDITAYGVDTSGQLDTSQSGASARYVIYPGDSPPVVSENLLSPVNGTLFTEGRIAVSGRVEDDLQIARVEVAIVDVSGDYMRSDGSFSSGSSWRNAFINSPGSPGSNFSYTTPVIPDGGYTVLVRGVDHHGFVTDPPAERTASVTSPPNDPPVAAFTYSCDENVCTFDGRSSTDENPVALLYSWNFGNGGGSGPVPERTYTSPGIYTVELTVEDEWGLEATTAQDIEIVTPAGNVAPVPEIYAPPCNLLTCNFSSLGSVDPNEGDSFTRLWDFGDGATSSSSATSHTYDTPGTYTVTLTLTDGWGAAASTTVNVTFVVPGNNVAPVPVIETPVCSGLTCEFSSINSLDPNADDTFTRTWDFGDTIGTSNSVSPTYAFAAAGTYTVTLTVTDVWLFEASTTVEVTVTDP